MNIQGSPNKNLKEHEIDQKKEQKSKYLFCSQLSINVDHPPGLRFAEQSRP